jgi:hypothetical protein
MGIHLLSKIFPAGVDAPGMDSVDFRQQFEKIHKPPNECKKKHWEFNVLANVNEITSRLCHSTTSGKSDKKRGLLASRPRRLQEYKAMFS